MVHANAHWHNDLQLQYILYSISVTQNLSLSYFQHNISQLPYKSSVDWIIEVDHVDQKLDLQARSIAGRAPYCEMGELSYIIRNGGNILLKFSWYWRRSGGIYQSCSVRNKYLKKSEITCLGRENLRWSCIYVWSRPNPAHQSFMFVPWSIQNT